MASYIPSVKRLLKGPLRYVMEGGVIVPRESTDINDAKSRMHQLHAISPSVHGSYITVDTGKYTTDPLIALKTAETVEDIVR